ncbi:MAG: lysophospholipase [Actinobacteria bacterium]|nr:lysophospholipase [Actinomycetota bacterium]
MERFEGFKTASDGARLFSRRWAPDADPKGTIVLVHGFAEHSGRYENVASRLCAAGYVLSSFDLRGHGRSAGRRGDCRFEPTLRDIDELLTQEEERGRGLPLFLYGHSLGGLLVLTYGIERKPRLAGIVASGPALHTSLTEQRFKVLISRALGGVIPSVSLPAGLDAALLSRDPAVVEDYRSDPLVHKRASFGFARDALGAMDRVLAEVCNLPVPLLVIHGGADRVNYVTGSEVVARELGDRCTLRVYDEILHQPHTDPDTETVLDEVIAWLDERVAAPADDRTRPEYA